MITLKRTFYLIILDKIIIRDKDNNLDIKIIN